VAFVVDKVRKGQVSLRVLNFSPITYNSTNAPDSFTHLPQILYALQRIVSLKPHKMTTDVKVTFSEEYTRVGQKISCCN
jgi:hypothetical protein